MPTTIELRASTSALESAARDAGLTGEAPAWLGYALFECCTLGSYGSMASLLAAVQQTTAALVELQSLRAQVADLHNILTPLIVTADELVDDEGALADIPSIEQLEVFTALSARWRQHKAQHGKGSKEADEGQRELARESTQEEDAGDGF